MFEPASWCLSFNHRPIPSHQQATKYGTIYCPYNFVNTSLLIPIDITQILLINKIVIIPILENHDSVSISPMVSKISNKTLKGQTLPAKLHGCWHTTHDLGAKSNGWFTATAVVSISICTIFLSPSFYKGAYIGPYGL